VHVPAAARPQAAHEQARTDQVLQLADLLAERRLRHAQPLRRLAEVQRIGNSEEVTQVAEFDGHGASLFIVSRK